MTRPGRTWNTYARLVAAAGVRYGGTLIPSDVAQPQEEEWLKRLSAELHTGSPHTAKVQDLLRGLEIGEKQFRFHLRYLARWGQERRRLLAAGANFQLLEGLKREEDSGALVGLELSGPLQQQRRQLSEHLNKTATMPTGTGWLSPMPCTGRKVRVYDARQVVWIYPPGEVDFLEGLHPSVARSLIARYVPQPGIVADPMAGDGVVPQMAVQMGHTAWASDIAPAQPYIRQLDLLDEKLSVIFGEEHLVSADLLVLHPPLPETLGLSEPRYTDWLEDILTSCLGAVKAGGHVALVVPITAQFPLMARAQSALLRIASEVAGQDIGDLAALHVAVSRDGREGWHLLVSQIPAINETLSGEER